VDEAAEAIAAVDIAAGR
jgi:hypothetical protein